MKSKKIATDSQIKAILIKKICESVAVFQIEPLPEIG
jgi:hypothetical protein